MRKWVMEVRGTVAGDDILIASKEYLDKPDYMSAKELLKDIHPTVKDPYVKVTRTEEHLDGILILNDTPPAGHGVTNMMYLRKYYPEAARGFRPIDVIKGTHCSAKCPADFGLDNPVEVKCYKCKQCWYAEARLPENCAECSARHYTDDSIYCTIDNAVDIYSGTVGVCRAKGCPVEKNLKELIDAEARKSQRREAKGHKLQDDSVRAEAGQTALDTLGDGLEANETRDAAEACGSNGSTSL